MSKAGARIGETKRGGLLIAGLAGVGMLIALYLAAVKLTGGAPVCGPLVGCETVNTSEYAQVLGIPVALFGAAASVATLVAGLAWWRSGSRRGLVTAYIIGLASLPILAYLTYLELFVVHAICAWCVAYATVTISAWLVAAVEIGRRRAA